MQRTQLWPVGLCVFLCLAGTVTAETVDNPAYQMWAAWREGASVTFKSETVVDGKVQITATATQALKKLTADKAVIEVSTVGEFGGQAIKSGPVSTDIPAKLPKEPAANPEDAPKPTNVPKFKETKGRETLTVNGKKLNCEWAQIEVEGGGVTKTWTCDEVPLGLVKQVASGPGSKVTNVLLEWKGTKK